MLNDTMASIEQINFLLPEAKKEPKKIWLGEHATNEFSIYVVDGHKQTT